MSPQAGPAMQTDLADLACRASGPVMIIGAADAGKSTVATALAAAMLRAGRRVALVDSDLGQSQVGPPACVGLALPKGAEAELRPAVPVAMAFVGDTSPVGQLLETAVAACKMVRFAARLGAEVVVVNTSGLVLGTYGRRLKLAKAALIRPHALVALQRRAELEHLLEALERQVRARVVRLPPPVGVHTKEPEERRLGRRERFRAYFASARSLGLETGQLIVSGHSLGGGPRLPRAERTRLQARLGAGVAYAEAPWGEARRAVVEVPVAGHPGVSGLRLAQTGSFRRLLGGLIGYGGICLALCLIESWGADELRVLTPLTAERISEVSILELARLGLDDDLLEFRPSVEWTHLGA